MAEARHRRDWELLSHALAWIENANKAKGRPTQPIERNPLIKNRPPEDRLKNYGPLKSAWLN